MTARRLQRFKAALDRRQPDLTVVLDGVHKPHNFSAILRTCDAVGVPSVHIVPSRSTLPAISSTAQGSQKWVDVHRHGSFSEAAKQLKERGFTLYAAHLTHDAKDFRAVDLSAPSAIVLGTEKFGLDDASLALVDQPILVPMQGLVQSLNVSVAAALILFEAQRQRLENGLYDTPRIAAPERRRMLFRWLHPRVAAQCDARGLAYPDLDEDGAIIPESLAR